MGPVRIFGREPALWVGFLTAVLSVAGMLGFDNLSALQAAAIAGGLNALGAIVTAWQVRPIAPAIYTNAVAAGTAIANAYGTAASPQMVLGLNAVMLAALALLTRGQVSPAGAAAAVSPAAPVPVLPPGPPPR